MPALTPQFLMDLETRMRVITVRNYERLLNNLWWQRLATERPSDAKKEIITFLLQTARITDQGQGGNVRMEDLVSTYLEYTNRDAGAGLKLHVNQLKDTDGGGMQLAAQWSNDMGVQMAYWPQKLCAHYLKNGHDSAVYKSYDQLAPFAAARPVNPFRTSAGTYNTIFTGAAVAASGNTPYYPGACPIDVSVTVDVALQNLAKIFGYVSSIRQANGEDPRGLKPLSLFCPPTLFPRAVQLTNAKFIAQAATSGGGSGDVEALINALGYAMPIMVPELAGFESDTTFFVGAQDMLNDEVGACIYSDREPFTIDYYGLQTDAVLGKARELEWLCHGRNVVSPGHPYLLFKCKGA